MSMMGSIEAQDMVWFAVQVKPRAGGGVRTTVVDAEYEAYRDRQGRVRKRRIGETGKRVFVPELILRRAGFDVFLPVKKDWRRKNRFSPEKHLVARPLLVNWVFVGWDQRVRGWSAWSDLMRLDLVSGVMGSGGRPVAIGQKRIMELMRQWGGGRLPPEMHRQLKQKHNLATGSRARIVVGPLDGTEVRVIDVNGSSVRATLGLLGREVETELLAEDLEALNPEHVQL
jgi:transcription antitermination factor NusG